MTDSQRPAWLWLGAQMEFVPSLRENPQDGSGLFNSTTVNKYI